MAKCFYACVIDVHQLAAVVRNRIDNVLILDSRSFLEYNVSHVMNAVNVGCAKLMKRRLQQDKLSIQDFLAHSCHWNVETDADIIVYDQSTENPSCLNPDSFLYVFLQKLLPVYKTVNVLKGGYLEFQAAYPNLCEDDKAKYTPLTSLSQPCLPISDHGPTRILSFLYLGSQHDALNKEVLLNHNITYELNVSTNCPKPDFIQESHFMRIPVIDNYSEKLLPYFPKAFQFLDKVRESGGCALVHCLAGISRSATVAIAYLMRHLKMSSDEAYRFVKAKRATISPNFNFLGQLLEYEKQLQKENILETKPSVQCQKIPSLKAACVSDEFDNSLPLNANCENGNHKLYSEQFLLEVPSFTCVKPRENFLLDNSKSTNNNNNPSDVDVSYKTLNKQFSMRKGKKIEADEWSSKCLPFSSLKQLNFTPCQTAISTNSKNHMREFNSWSAGDTYTQTCVYTQVPSSSYVADSQMKKNDPSFDLAVFENILSECKMETFSSISSLPSSMWQVNDNAQSLVQSGEYSDKDYKRSDSTSTSGLGSEGSDFMDSWNEYHSSCERDTDMDEDYSSVPAEDDYQRSRSELQDLYGETSLYGKFGEPEYGKDIKRSLSPFKAPFFADYSQVNELEHGATTKNRKNKTTFEHFESTTGSMLNRAQVPVDSMKVKKSSEGLYRAQSCPGIISDEFITCSSPATKQSEFSIVKRVRNRDSSKNRNRYSCSSLDYMDYPNVVPSFRSSGTESVSALSTPHQLYRHSMIQVS